jgi:oligopeptide/dipeptide ABC transporter ATP-binding protein
MTGRGDCILAVRKVRKYFEVKGKSPFHRGGGQIRAVDGVSFDMYRGETLGVVGESGCGKSTMGRVILRLLEPTSGEINFEGVDITELRGKALRKLRTDMQVVFQDPYSSLNPRMRIGDIISEPMRGCLGSPRWIRWERARELLREVGLDPIYTERFPHEFSGGQRQRIGLARALSIKPKVVVCDEPVSALDVSIQAQIINLFQDLQSKFHLTYLFIAHDLSVIKHICDRIMVMYLGKIIETAPKDSLYNSPAHPYTRALMAAIPIPDRRVKRHRVALTGEVPSPINIPTGCRFHPRCPLAKDICREIEPQMTEKAPEHFAACHLCGET